MKFDPCVFTAMYGESPSPVSTITERSDMGMCEMPLSMSLLEFRMGTMLANFHMFGIMLLLRAVLNIVLRNASPGDSTCLGA